MGFCLELYKEPIQKAGKERKFTTCRFSSKSISGLLFSDVKINPEIFLKKLVEFGQRFA